jgi:putative acetyltransferase
MPTRRRHAPRATDRLSIHQVRGPREIEAARELFREYRAWLVEHREVTAFADSVLATGLGYFDKEMADLPGAYRPPGGALFVAYDGPTPVGCAALRELTSGVGELKRVFVRPSHRGGGVGRRLTARILQQARKEGHQRVVLDTLPRMVHAISLYKDMGFLPIQPYWSHPVAEALFFELRLRGSTKRLQGRPGRTMKATHSPV